MADPRGDNTGPQVPPLLDWTRRKIDYLRISVTDRCNFSCVYCKSADPKNYFPHDDLLTWDEYLRAARVLATAVDLMRIAFFGAMTVLTVQMMLKMGNYQMTIVDLPMNIVYGVCLFGFAAMALRSAWVARVHWRRGYSVLQRPETTMDDER